jgi:hypothetical protein
MSTTLEATMTKHEPQEQPMVFVNGQPLRRPQAPRPPDAPRDALGQVAREHTRQQRTWRSVRMPAYRELGKRIVHIEAIDSGEEEMRGDGQAGERATVILTPSEQLACLRGACLQVARALERNLEAVLSYRPEMGEDLVLVEVAVKASETADRSTS